MGKNGSDSVRQPVYPVPSSAIYNPSQKEKPYETRVKRSSEDDPARVRLIEDVLKRLREKSSRGVPADYSQ